MPFIESMRQQVVNLENSQEMALSSRLQEHQNAISACINKVLCLENHVGAQQRITENFFDMLTTQVVAFSSRPEEHQKLLSSLITLVEVFSQATCKHPQMA